MKRTSGPLTLLCLILLLASCASAPIGGPTAPRDDPAAGVLTVVSGRSYPVFPQDLAYTGEAHYRWPDGREYDGEWVEGLPQGMGAETLPDGERYRGSWAAGRRNGHGELNRADGSHYVGDFVNDRREGEGTERSSDGLYRGSWFADLPDGLGAFHGDDGTSYEGQWAGGQRSGYGEYTDGQGNYYEGDWVNDRPHGFGTMTDTSAGTYSGHWKDGRQQGYGRAENPSEVIYEGTWVGGQRQGYGVVQRPDGSSYAGQWLDGRRNGLGKEVFADGSYHQGDWRADQVLGPGTRRDRTGIGLRGYWDGDRLPTGLLRLPTGDQYTGPLLLGENDEVSGQLVTWLTTVAERGNPYAQFFLGTVYADSRKPAPDAERARALFDKAAQAGIAEAQFRLAIIATDLSPSRVIELLSQAAQGGQAQASALLGEYYLQGRWVPASAAKAIAYLEQASRHGDLAARNNLAWILATCANDDLRDADAALELIRPIALSQVSWRYQDTLAAAFAATGDFDAAEVAQSRAIDRARAEFEGRDGPIPAMQQRLDLYQQHRAYRERESACL